MEFGIKLLESVIQELRDMPDEEFMALYRQNTKNRPVRMDSIELVTFNVTVVMGSVSSQKINHICPQSEAVFVPVSSFKDTGYERAVKFSGYEFKVAA